MVAAGVVPEFGLFPMDETGGRYATAAAWWADTAGLRAGYATYLEGWTGGCGLSGDNWFYDPTASGGGIQGAPLKAWYDRGWTAEAVGYQLSWLRSVGSPLAIVYRDEMEYPFGADPDADPTAPATAPGLKPNNFDGPAPVSAFVAAWYDTHNGCVIGPGSATVTADTPVGWTGWQDDEYARLVAQYHSPGYVGPDPWTPLPASRATMGYAARQRRLTKPFSLNLTTVVATSTTSSLGGVPAVTDANYLRGGAYRPEHVGGQMWIALGLGATVIRCYLLESYGQRANRLASPSGTYTQAAVNPLSRLRRS
jgi:hypothetical protein